MSQFDPSRLHVYNTEEEMLKVLKVMLDLLTQIRDNTAKGKPGRPRKVVPRG